MSTVIPVETHWHGGVVERHGATAKTIIRKLVDTHSTFEVEDMRLVLQEAAAAKNSRVVSHLLNGFLDMTTLFLVLFWTDHMTWPFMITYREGGKWHSS